MTLRSAQNLSRLHPPDADYGTANFSFEFRPVLPILCLFPLFSCSRIPAHIAEHPNSVEIILFPALTTATVLGSL